MAFLATVGPFIYIFLQHRAEARLMKEQRRYQDTLKHAAIGMTRIRNMRKLLSLIAHIVTKTVRISFASIYLYDEIEDKFVLQVSRDKGRTVLAESPGKSALATWLHRHKQPIIAEEIKRLAQENNNPVLKIVVEDIQKFNGAVIIPSFLEDKLLGFIVLGDKLSGQMYTPDDLNVFQVLASQAALAIENAQFYEQAKEMQAQIAQAEKMATVGTMADGLSHQINNRFYALSLIAGDSIDTIKMTDTANCSPEIQDMIKQISAALERIQNNVMQGGEVVKGILKYTRKGEEGIEALTVDQIIDGTLDMVQYKVKLHEIDLIRDYPKDLPKLRGNLVQMEEAFFNFIDNGYDAINERKATLKEPGFRGQIKITAYPKGEMLEIVIQDNGMGVKNDDIKKIFTPFFTTKVSSRKGTGLGLYVIRSIITETHNGKIAFESTHKVGTKFTIQIPIAKT
jgi:signal transduction histidine kinase